MLRLPSLRASASVSTGSARPGLREAPVGPAVLGLALLLACATTPRVPAEPTPEEQPLVDRAQAWCEDAGYLAGEPSRPFFTDSCTGWIDGDLHECCVEHDIAYWCGGSKRGRLDADRRFRACAEERSPAQSGLVYYGVRMGGVPWLPTSWRWGYGHPFGAGYAEPKPEQSPAEGALLGSPQ